MFINASKNVGKALIGAFFFACRASLKVAIKRAKIAMAAIETQLSKPYIRGVADKNPVKINENGVVIENDSNERQ